MAAWAGLIVGGFGRLIKYEGLPGPIPPSVAQNPDFASSNRMSLVLALHPHCPCSRATVGELMKVYSHAQGKFALTVLVFKPKGESDEWLKSRTLDTLKALDPKVVIDLDGTEAGRLGLATSGQVLLYDHQGSLRYNGGITGARGHAGDNAGESAVLAILNNTISNGTSLASAPVFGCSLSSKTP